ncbi:DUF4381 domain-containing protein [Pseudohaliea rubra]|uniref:DUF4381 domain-containing protein n=1 Tax=Pseudohaliea rubra DSM 19751 TaxID=1265313 RepID=A0A095VS23_9GAMM|nr:DUF4381 domain-containing protein [Pseudohaliea rubra]KGE04257.1 hypothetical protein HRUBRA_01121 [Pseudohaliea rubra DSM 19751]
MSDPLDPGSLVGLVDIVEAPALPLWWPLPPLVWMLLALLAAAAVAWLWRFQRCWHGDRYRREAVAGLAGASADPAERLRQARMQLKRAAITAYGREGVAPLDGAPWWTFLDERCAGSAFAKGPGAAADRALARGCAPGAGELEAFEAATVHWLRSHRREGP